MLLVPECEHRSDPGDLRPGQSRRVTRQRLRRELREHTAASTARVMVREPVVNTSPAPSVAPRPVRQAEPVRRPRAPATAAGTCMPGASTPCGNYVCNSATLMCRASCASNVDCGASAYRATPTCSPKKDAGQLCSQAQECSSGVCGGRCCAAGTSCMCPQPSSQNLLRNPGFDSDISGWTIDPGTTAMWASGDSLAAHIREWRLSMPAVPRRGWPVRRCVPVDLLRFGVRMRSAPTSSTWFAYSQIRVAETSRVPPRLPDHVLSDKLIAASHGTTVPGSVTDARAILR